MNSDARSVSWCALDIDRPLVLIDGPFHESQTESCTFGSMRTSCIGSIEAFENMWQGLSWNPTAFVAHLEHSLLCDSENTNCNAAFSRRELDRIVNDVEDDAFDPAGITNHLHIRLKLTRQRNAFG